ncbi:alanine/glycine:cation symporter family protein [Aeoliella sp. SH292]|uniref:alanine/glycine:cation symporter family protein n=1 Tax=Aeoliella sp. SH292 TaxID=3454464 RepID=UPI003F9DD143
MLSRSHGTQLPLLVAATLLLVGVLTNPAFAQDPPAEPSPPAPAEVEAAENAASSELTTWRKYEAKVDNWAKTWLVDPMDQILFAGIYGYEDQGLDGAAAKFKLPLVVAWLAGMAVFLTFYFRFINFRAFWHAIRVTKGDYDDPKDSGEVSHFQALASALSATVGLGNIAGVAIAVGTGGPGAVFWLIVAGLFGMTSKFAECTLGQMYRKIDADGHVSGGPMRYLYTGLAEKGLGPLGFVLSILFAVLCIGGSFGGGCSFQVSQSKSLVLQELGLTDADWAPWAYGALMVVMVGVVIIGGIKRIASTAEKIVPLMCGVYVLAALTILVMNYHLIPSAFYSIVSEAFTPQAGYGGFLGVMVVGIRRAAFSNEAGAGSAAIAHSAARTKYPVREGIVALLEPFIDTVVVCTMTGLVVVITGVYDSSNPQSMAYIQAGNGSALTSMAFKSQISWFPAVLTLASFLFAYSTMISWSYYGERCFTFLFGARTSMLYRGLFLVAIMMGAIVNANNVMGFSDYLILSMAFPNLIGVLILSGNIRTALNDYWAKYKAGEFIEYNKLKT